MEIYKLITRVCKKWDYYKGKEVSEKKEWSGSTSVETLNGYGTEWDNPDLLWVFSESESEGGGYDGSGIQVGLAKDGKFYWEYQSHCSCNEFYDSTGHDVENELCLGCDEKPKSYELSQLPNDWEKIVKVNLEEILKTN